MSTRPGRVVPWLRAAVDRSLPPLVLAQDSTTRRRARLTVILPLLGGLGALAGLLVQIVLERPAIGIRVSLVGCVASLLATQAVRATGSVKVAGHLIAGLMFTFTSISALVAGGLGAPRAFALILVPMLATLLVGWRGGLVWMGLVAAEVFTLLTMTFVGPELAPAVADAVTFQRAHAAGVLIIMAFAMLIIASYDRAHADVAEELESALERADAVSRLKSALVANVSHELRTPLNGVLGSTDLLMRSGLDDVQRGHAETIETSSEALLKLVDDLLDMSRLEAGGMELEATAVQLRRVLGDTMIALAPIAEARAGGRLVLHVEPDVPEQVVTDPYRLRQVLTNLVNNAIKFTDEGHVVLRVAMADERVRFEVSDTGIGFDDEDRERLFGAFEQARASTARHYGGTGLGLNIARRLVVLMGGDIAVQSVAGEGSTFSFELALEHAPADATAFASHEEPETHRVAVRLADPLEAAAARAALRWAGHTVVEEGEAVVVHDGSYRAREWSVRVVSPSELGGRVRTEVRIARPFAPATLAKSVWRAAHQAPSSRPPMSSQTGRGRVLVADDTLVNRRVAAGQLTHLGYDPVVVDDGAAAVAAVTADPRFVGIFLDVRMPVMDGYEAVRAIRAWEKETGMERTPVFALTAHEESGQRRLAAEAGFDRFLVKPMRIEDFELILEGARVRIPRAATPLTGSAWEELEMLAGEEPGFLDGLVRSFVETSSRRITELEEGGDAAELAHALKGAARQLGATAFADVCEQLESAPDRRDELLPALVRELQRAEEALLARVEAERAAP
ncbi:MAG: response regulator [Sandaracinaceae bacterium]|nr:response regulator [Sandaracinaceae bacterium]